MTEHKWVRLGRQVKSWYLNVNGNSRDVLDKMGSSGCSYLHKALFISIALVAVSLVASGADASSEVDNYWWDPYYELDIENASVFPRTVEFSPTGDEVAFFADDLRIINVSTKETVLTWEPPYDMNPTFMSWTNDGAMLAWRLVDRIQVFSIQDKKIVVEIEFIENVRFFLFSPDDAYMGVLSEHYIFMINTTTWNQTVRLEAEDTSFSTVYSISWHPSGDTFYVLGGAYGYLYETETWMYIGTLRSFHAGKRGVWTEDGRFIHSVRTTIYEYDPLNETDTYMVGGLKGGYIIPMYDESSNDVVIHEYYEPPKIFNRGSGRYRQDLGQLVIFANEPLVEHVSVSSDGRYMAIVWQENYTYDHMTVLRKKLVDVTPLLYEVPKPAFAMLRSYNLSFGIPPLIEPDSIISVLLDIGGSSQITWSVEDGSMSTSNSHLILEGMTLSRGPSSILVCTVWFNWSFPEVEGCNMTLVLQLTEGIRLRWEYADAFDVVTSLEITGQIQAEGEFQGPLENNSWARADETINWTLPKTSYRGHPEVHPRSHHVAWFFHQDGHLEWSGNPGTDGHGRAITDTPIVDLGAPVFTAVATTVHDNRTFGTSIFRLRVDGLPPNYVEHIPEQGVWQATTTVHVGARVVDANGSGLVPGSLKISWRTGAGDWSRWENVTVDVIDLSTVFGISLIGLQEGEDNWVRWTCIDSVGNKAGSGPLAVLVDLTHVRFSAFDPQGWVNVTSLECSINISDIGGSGVSGSSVQVRWSTNGLPYYGSWASLDLTGTQQSWSVSRTIQLLEGVDNYVQWRAEDVAGTGLTDSEHFQIWIDASPPTFGRFSPTAIQTDREVPLSIEVGDNGSSGVTPDDVEWRMDDEAWREIDQLADGMARASLSVSLDGSFNMTFRARDGAGNTVISRTNVVTVDTSPPEIIQIEPAPGSYIIGTRCTVKVLVQDRVSGVNASSVMFSLRRGSGSDWSEWQQMADVTENDGTMVASTMVELHPDHDNWIRVRASDLVGNGPSLSPDIRLPVDLHPIAAISSPDANETYLDDMRILFDSSGSDDPEGNITVEWNIDEGWYETTEPMFKVRIPAGVHNVTLIVIDEAGQMNETKMTLNVMTTEEETWSGQWWLFLVVLIAVIAAAAVLVYRRNQT